MFVRWKRSVWKDGGRYHPHCRHQGPGELLTPVVFESVRLPDKKNPSHVQLWRPGVGIRACCIEAALPRALWWDTVLGNLEELDVTSDVGHRIWHAKKLLLELLAHMVQKPPAWARKRVEADKAARAAFHGPPFFCDLLGLPWPFTEEDLKKAWRPLALAHHPDRGGDEEEFKKYNAAYIEARTLLFGL